MRRSENPSSAALPGSSYGHGVAIVASAGGIPALIELLRAAPNPAPFPLFVLQHLHRRLTTRLVDVLRWHTAQRVEWAVDGAAPECGTTYVCPPACGLRVSQHGLEVLGLPDSARSWLVCPDALFASVASSYGAGSVGIVLSGMLPVGLRGMRDITAQGGLAMAQNESSSAFFEMPGAAVDFGRADIVLSPPALGRALSVLNSMLEQPARH
jgi:chemotaxis response regulator CheB